MGIHPQEVQGKQNTSKRTHVKKEHNNQDTTNTLNQWINPSYLQVYRNLTEWNLRVSLAS